jgi:hypothetical protein
MSEEEAVAQTAESEADAGPRSGLVFKRAAGLFLVCMIAVGVLALGLIQGVIPTQLVLSKSPFKLAIDQMVVNDLSAYVGHDPLVESGQKGVAVAGIEDGEADNLCLSTVLDLPFVGPLSIEITSGANRTIDLEEIVAQAEAMAIGDVVVDDVDLGVDAATMQRSGQVDGPAGGWGLELRQAVVDDLKVDGEAIKVLSLKLRGLGLGLALDERHCFEPDEQE